MVAAHRAGLLRARSADLDRLAAVPAIRPWLEVIHRDKRLRASATTSWRRSARTAGCGWT